MRGNIRKEVVHDFQQGSDFFKNGILNAWNNLSDAIIEAPSTNAFKNKLDKVQQSFFSSYSSDWKLRVHL